MKPAHVLIVASLRLTEAAQMIHVHPETLRRWADEGKVPYVRTPGGQRRFSPDDLAALMGGKR